MKKLKTLIITTLCLVAVFALVGCGCSMSKTAISADDFKNKVETQGYIVHDDTDHQKQLTNVPDAISKVYVGQNATLNKIEFWQLSEDKYANSMYNNNLPTYDSNIGIKTNVSVGNSDKFTIKKDGKYTVLERVGNTFVLAQASDTDEDALDKTLESLGY